jgi:hypothetical protein
MPNTLQSHIIGNASTPWPLGRMMYHHTPVHTAFDNVNGQGRMEGGVSFGSGSDSFYEYLLKSHLMSPALNPHLCVSFSCTQRPAHIFFACTWRCIAGWSAS